MRHPSTVWVDPTYADEPLDRLPRDCIDYLKSRAQPTSPETVIKYNSSLLCFTRLLEPEGEEQVLGCFDRPTYEDIRDRALNQRDDPALPRSG